MATRCSSSPSIRIRRRINVIAAVGEPAVVLVHALRLRAAVLPEPPRGWRPLRARRVRRQGHPCGAGGGGGPDARRAARRASASSSWRARSAAAKARWRPTASRRASRYLINGEPTDNRLGAATRGVFRVRLRDRGRGRPFGLSVARPFGHRGPHRRAGLVARRIAGPRTRCSAARTTRWV